MSWRSSRRRRLQRKFHRAERVRHRPTRETMHEGWGERKSGRERRLDRDDERQRRGITSEFKQIQRLRMQETRKNKCQGRETQRSPADMGDYHGVERKRRRAPNRPPYCRQYLSGGRRQRRCCREGRTGGQGGRLPIKNEVGCPCKSFAPRGPELAAATGISAKPVLSDLP